MRARQLGIRPPKTRQSSDARTEAARETSDPGYGYLTVTSDDEYQSLVGMVTEAGMGEVLATMCRSRSIGWPASEE